MGGIMSSNALYFVSKISELNLIESMLQHKKSKDEQLALDAVNGAQSGQSSANLDHLFMGNTATTPEGDDGNGTGDNNGNTPSNAGSNGADYLNDVIFNIGSDD